MTKLVAASPELLLRSLDATWDREQWDLLPRDGNRYEVIAGVLYVSPLSTPLHQWISGQVQRLIYSRIDGCGVDLTLHAPLGLFMGGCDPAQPDIMVLRPEDQALIQEQRLETIPLLLIEILSEIRVQHDLILKRDAYARAGVPEYWALRPQERDILVHSDLDTALWSISECDACRRRW